MGHELLKNNVRNIIAKNKKRVLKKMKLLGQGWHSVMINPIHKNITVIHWLKSQKAVFKYSRNEFLIKEEKDAIMVALKFA
jgi:hypothetical protein